MPKNTFFNLPAEKRNKIIEAAIGEFSKTHYQKVTIDNIVNRADISKGSFYQYFKDKDDLYKYLFSQIVDQKKQALHQVKKDQDRLDFRGYLLQMLEEARKFETRLTGLKDKFINQCPQEVRKEVLKEEIPKSYHLFEEILAAYIERGELRKDLNIKTAAYTIISCFASIEYYPFAQGEELDIILPQILDILINGMKIR